MSHHVPESIIRTLLEHSQAEILSQNLSQPEKGKAHELLNAGLMSVIQIQEKRVWKSCGKDAETVLNLKIMS